MGRKRQTIPTIEQWLDPNQPDLLADTEINKHTQKLLSAWERAKATTGITELFIEHSAPFYHTQTLFSERRGQLEVARLSWQTDLSGRWCRRAFDIFTPEIGQHASVSWVPLPVLQSVRRKGGVTTPIPSGDLDWSRRILNSSVRWKSYLRPDESLPSVRTFLDYQFTVKNHLRSKYPWYLG